MHPQLEAVFNEAETRYLKSEELNLINQYVDSLPARLEAYRALRECELVVMQQVADQIQAAMPQEKIENLERSIKNALLLLRYCAIGMLLNDDSFVQERLINWLSSTISIHNTPAIDTQLYRLLNQGLSKTLSPNQVSLLSPYITKAQTVLLQPAPTPALV